MKKLAWTLLFFVPAAHGAEIERTPVSAPVTVVAPPPLTGGVNVQLDAALAPGARVEASNEALANAATLLQGGAPTAQNAAAPTTDAQSLPAGAAPALAAPTKVAAAQKPGVRAPRPAEKKDPAQWALHLTAALVIVATILTYAFFIKGLSDYANDLERDFQQQMRQVDDWGR